ncbi:MAG: DUF2202 domain-containing protein [Spirochaetes bacterium]|nr:DUF2202 domain-containing protein [Spirochaetota bacterium]
MQSQIDSYPEEEISEEEAAGLIFMKEEEKLARDVYRVMYSNWNLRPFGNITEAEQRHMDAITMLLEKYEIQDPVTNDSTGVFTNQDLQTLYNTLISQGSQSEIEGLKVGAAIEEIDILDLQKELDDNVDNEDITFVYENLMRGSRNHLRAYVRNLDRRGITYEPQYMTEEQYLLIINSERERGWKF